MLLSVDEASVEGGNGGGQAMAVHAANFPSALHIQVLHSSLYFSFGVHLNSETLVVEASVVVVGRGGGGQSISVQAADFPSGIHLHVLQSSLNDSLGTQLYSEALIQP